MTSLPRRAHHMLVLVSLAMALIWAPPAFAGAQPVFPGQTWENADPVKMGWSLPKLKTAKAYAEEIGSSAVMIVQDGRVIASWGDVQRKMQIYSVRKSLLSALYGIAVAKKQVDLKKTLAELGIDDKPPSLAAAEKKATVRDLLMARSGVYHEAAYESAPQAGRRPERGSHGPGTFWYYNNWDFDVLGVILRDATGEDRFAAVEKYLARPLQMEDFTPADGRYFYNAATEHPAYPMRFTARDLARFGWLYLNRGKWGDQQVVPAQWVAESTKHKALFGCGPRNRLWVHVVGFENRHTTWYSRRIGRVSCPRFRRPICHCSAGAAYRRRPSQRCVPASQNEQRRNREPASAHLCRGSEVRSRAAW